MSQPGNSAASRDIAGVIHPYTNLSLHRTQGPLVLVEGDGIFVRDDAGKEYIEGLAGLWCTSLGYGEERLVTAAAEAMRRLPFSHIFGHKSHEAAIDLAEKLLAMAPVPMSKVLFSNSGSEANDTAVKLVWYYNNALDRPEKKKIIARDKGYHGVTVAAASLTGLPHLHRDFDLPIQGILHTDCPHYRRYGEEGESEEDFASRLAASLDALIRAEGPETVAAFIAEPVIGAGGVLVPPATYFDRIQAVLREHDVLLIADEVICGFGRTGRMFGTETYGLKPDMMTCAKALSSAYLPISAVMLSEPIYQAMITESEKVGTFGHGYTYTGHPVCAAVALETLRIYEERDIVGHARALAPHFLERLHGFADHPLAYETRGVGLIGAVEFAPDGEGGTAFDPAGRAGLLITRAAERQGLIVRNIGDAIAFCPPLIITAGQIDDMFDRFGRALDEATEELRREGLTA